jgi:phage gp36-like protein
VAARRYASAEDVSVYGLPGPALEGVTTAVIEQLIDYASSRIDDAIDPAIRLPFDLDANGKPKIPISLKRDCCVIVAYEILRIRGFNPEGSDKLVVDEYLKVQKRLEDVGSFKNTIVVDRDEPPPPLRAYVDAPPSVYGRAADRKERTGF